MTRLTKWLTAAAVMAGVGFTAQAASAHPTVVVQPTILPYPNPGPFPPRPYPPGPRIDLDYMVLYKPTFFGGWQRYGKFETHHSAEHALRRLEWQGYAARIVRVRDYHGGIGW